MEITAAGGIKTNLVGNPAHVLGDLPGLHTGNHFQTLATQVMKLLGQPADPAAGEIILARVSQYCDASGLIDGFYDICHLHPAMRDIADGSRPQILSECQSHSGYVASLHQIPREMGPRDMISSGKSPRTIQRILYTRPAQIERYRLGPLPALPGLPCNHFLQMCSERVNIQPQNMNTATEPLGGKFNPRDQCQTCTLRGLGSTAEPCERIVICQRQHIDSAAPGARHPIVRIQNTAGRIAMRVQIVYQANLNLIPSGLSRAF